jgi:hypothetical protein
MPISGRGTLEGLGSRAPRRPGVRTADAAAAGFSFNVPRRRKVCLSRFGRPWVESDENSIARSRWRLAGEGPPRIGSRA